MLQKSQKVKEKNKTHLLFQMQYNNSEHFASFPHLFDDNDDNDDNNGDNNNNNNNDNNNNNKNNNNNNNNNNCYYCYINK